MNYQEKIKESVQELQVLERQTSVARCRDRVRFIRLLKSGEATSQRQAAGLIGISHRQGQQPSLLILDGAGSHRADGLPIQECLQLQHLPAASPELNPVERFFKELRRDLANQVFADIEAVEQKIIKSLQRFWQHPSVVISLTRFPYVDAHNQAR